MGPPDGWIVSWGKRCTGACSRHGMQSSVAGGVNDSKQGTRTHGTRHTDMRSRNGGQATLHKDLSCEVNTVSEHER
eukprot:5033607-Prymnesium_polylepis.2